MKYQYHLDIKKTRKFNLMLSDKDYQEWVIHKTSNESKNLVSFKERLDNLNKQVNIPLLMTSAYGMAAEASEFSEIVKKLVFQGKELNEEQFIHMRKELGDVLFYMNQAFEALSSDYDEVKTLNIEKLNARYVNGFTVKESEIRKKGDV